MNERQLAEDILEIVLENAVKHEAQKVRTISVLVGELSDIKMSVLTQAFVELAANTLAAHAELDITYIPAVVYCHECKKRMTVEPSKFICSVCGSTRLEILTGDSLQIEDIEFD
jgi:hydrogenase nickel incorporation protein HypA/HybF